MASPHSGRNRTLAVAVAALFLWTCPGPVAAEGWQMPSQGVRYLKQTIPGVARFHVTVVDLSVPGVSLTMSGRDERWQTVSKYARRADLAVAVNGGAWSLLFQRAMGMAAGHGETWSEMMEGAPILAVMADGRAEILEPEEDVSLPSGIVGAVSGGPVLLRNGIVPPPIIDLRNGRDARTAVGVGRDGQTVFLIVAEGRLPSTPGATSFEMGALLQELGAWTAINLDGGKSSVLFLRDAGGRVSRPALGWEREVVNHIGIAAPLVSSFQERAREDALQGAALPTSYMHAVRTDIAQSDRGLRGWFSAFAILDNLFVGWHREWVVPGVLSVILMLPVCFALLAWRIIRGR